MTEKQKEQGIRGALRERSVFLYHELKPHFSDLSPPLNYRNGFELLMAVILSAQTTDAGVNKVTPFLFQSYPDAERMATANVRDIESIVHSLGFYRQKAKNIIKTAAILSERGGEVPSDWDSLLSLPGVGRKTASVIRSHLFSLPAIIVDTHFKRVAQRLDLTVSSDADTIEKELTRFVPNEIQSELSMILNFHGRKTCKARKPECYQCPVSSDCSQAVL